MNNSTESKMQDRISRILKLMVMHGENRFCFECHQRGPTYVDMTIGSFVCTGCGGALRKYNHRIKSFSVSNFSPTEIEFLCKRGNKPCRKIYLARCEKMTNLQDIKNNLDDHLRLKYQILKWYSEPTSEIEAEAIADNQEIMDQAERSEKQKSHTTPGVNAAKGLIITPPSQPSVKQSYTSTNARHIPSNSTNGCINNNDGGNKYQAQPKMPQPASDVFNGFGDDMFQPKSTTIAGTTVRLRGPPLRSVGHNEESSVTTKPQDDGFVFRLAPDPSCRKTSTCPVRSSTSTTSTSAATTTSLGSVASLDPFDAFASQGIESQTTEELDFFSSLVSAQPVQDPVRFASPATNTQPGGPTAFAFQTGNPVTNTQPTNPVYPVVSLPSQDKYAALAELDNMLKMKTGFSPVFRTTSIGAAGYATSNTSLPVWPGPTVVVTSQPVYSFPVAVTGVVVPPNPFTTGDATFTPFERNFTPTAPQNTSAAMPFMVASATNGLPTDGQVKPHNPFFSVSTGAPSVHNPFAPSYAVNSGLGQPGPFAGSTPNTVPAFQQPIPASQYWNPAGQLFLSSSGPNSPAPGNPWTVCYPQ